MKVRVCIPKKFPGGADAGGPGDHTLCSPDKPYLKTVVLTLDCTSESPEELLKVLLLRLPLRPVPPDVCAWDPHVL